MCHLILIGLPLLALSAFWFLPLTLAAPTFIALLAAALIFYAYLVKGTRRPVMTGIEAMQHAHGTVRSVQDGIAAIWVRSELWSARAVDGLREGDEVEVVGVDGLQLRVRKITRSVVKESNRSSS